MKVRKIFVSRTHVFDEKAYLKEKMEGIKIKGCRKGVREITENDDPLDYNLKSVELLVEYEVHRNDTHVQLHFSGAYIPFMERNPIVTRASLNNLESWLNSCGYDMSSYFILDKCKF